MSFFIYFCLTMLFIQSATASEIELLVGKDDGFRPEVHKYLVMFHISVYDSRQSFICSGSIIDKEWILTAAHCFPHDTKVIKIIQQQNGINRDIGFARDYVNHPDFIRVRKYHYGNAENDVALVRTLKPIKFNAYTQPIALVRLGAFGQEATIAGYGESKYGWGIPLEGFVLVTPCKSAPHGTRMLCSQSLAHAKIGDSGGSLMIDDGLVGVVSGTERTGQQSIFVNISLHFNWIQQVMGKKLHIIGLKQENIG